MQSILFLNRSRCGKTWLPPIFESDPTRSRIRAASTGPPCKNYRVEIVDGTTTSFLGGFHSRESVCVANHVEMVRYYAARGRLGRGGALTPGNSGKTGKSVVRSSQLGPRKRVAAEGKVCVSYWASFPRLSGPGNKHKSAGQEGTLDASRISTFPMDKCHNMQICEYIISRENTSFKTLDQFWQITLSIKVENIKQC